MGEAVAVRPAGSVTEAKWTLKRVDELVKIINQSYLELAELLFKINQNGYFRMLEGSDGEMYGTFEEYVTDRLGWKGRKGYYFVQIHRDLIEGAGLNRDDLAGVDHTKAQILATLPPEEKQPEKIKGWLEKAKTTKLDDLRATVNKTRMEVEKGKVFKTDVDRTEVFHLSADQQKNVLLAIDVAKKISGSDKKGFNLDMICLDFLSGRIQESKLMASRILRRVEDVFGVSVLALKPKGDDMEIVYGEKIARQYGIELEHKKKGLDIPK